MSSPPSCIRCNVAMELGFVPELSGQVLVSVWHPGAPTTVKKSWSERLACRSRSDSSPRPGSVARASRSAMRAKTR